MRIQEYLLWIAILAFEGFRRVQTVSLSTDCPPLNTVAANPHSQCGTSYFFFFSLVLTLVLCSNLCSEKKDIVYVQDIMHYWYMYKLIQKRVEHYQLHMYDGCCIFIKWEGNLIEIFPWCILCFWRTSYEVISGSGEGRGYDNTECF